MSKSKRRPSPNRCAAAADLRAFAGFFEGADEGRERFRWTLRDSLDELLDGQRTGRWCYQHLSKTERTYLGTAIEINLAREFDIEDGVYLDWSIAANELDCKFSREVGGWEIPMKMYICSKHGAQSGRENFPALLVWMNDDSSEWAAGLLHMNDARLKWQSGDNPERIYNGDNKRQIAPEALNEIYWLWGGNQKDLPPNLLLHLPADLREKILSPGSTGQGRINDLFRHVRDRLVNRAVVLTVGQQDDAPKRVRDARERLRDDGIIVLGHEFPHRRIARALGLQEASKGSWISTRVIPAAGAENSGSAFFLDGVWWTKAKAPDPAVPGPKFPKDWSQLATNLCDP
jgi:hypothetical protein